MSSYGSSLSAKSVEGAPPVVNHIHYKLAVTDPATTTPSLTIPSRVKTSQGTYSFEALVSAPQAAGVNQSNQLLTCSFEDQTEVPENYIIHVSQMHPQATGLGNAWQCFSVEKGSSAWQFAIRRAALAYATGGGGGTDPDTINVANTYLVQLIPKTMVDLS